MRYCLYSFIPEHQPAPRILGVDGPYTIFLFCARRWRATTPVGRSSLLVYVRGDSCGLIFNVRRFFYKGFSPVRMGQKYRGVAVVRVINMPFPLVGFPVFSV